MMTDETQEEEVIETNEEEATTEEEGAEEGSTEEETNEDDQEEGELVVSIGDEEQEIEAAPEWVKETRARIKETAKKNRALEREVEDLKTRLAPADDSMVTGEKPSMADDDINFDEVIYEEKLSAWMERKRKSEEKQNTAKQEQEQGLQEWENTKAEHADKKKELGIDDIDELEDTVKDILNEQQQAIILHVSENSAKVVVALANNPKKAAELAEIKDLMKFTAAVTRLEGSIKMTRRKAAPAPEKKIKGSPATSGNYDKQLAKLEKEADVSRDRSKIVKFKKANKEK